MNEEWGPWIEHDGKGCPCVGMFVHRVYNASARDLQDGCVKNEKVGPVTNPRSRSWIWTEGYARVIRYRIRKPRALLDLIEMVENLPAPVGPKVDA